MRYTHDPLNFHIVKEGVLYRSAQPTGDDIRMIHTEYGIKSIINLRGKRSGKDWYDEEIEVIKELGLRHADIPLPLERLPDEEHLKDILDAFNNLPQPILVHCKAGADRTGMAAAMFVFDHMNQQLDEDNRRQKAAGQLHPYFGHIPDFKPVQTYFIRDVYEGEEWVLKDYYDPCNIEYRYNDSEEQKCN
jgi:protein tyrosine phosphatase (PTP) superfamily phosphohydrolase (DUF442 family)